MADKNLEGIVQKQDERDISLGRVALTTLAYGFVGAFFDDARVVAPLTAATGLGLSVYNEVKQKGMNLVWPAAGILVGVIMGSLFDINKNAYLPNALAYGGALLGGVLGFYKSYLTQDNKRYSSGKLK